jgi:hypothetical protein
MVFEWLEQLQRARLKDAEYAEKTLAAYALGMKAHGPITGVTIDVGRDCCEAAHALPAGQLYDPASAPRLPLPGCPRGNRCPCVYRPVMTYQSGHHG